VVVLPEVVSERAAKRGLDGTRVAADDLRADWGKNHSHCALSSGPHAPTEATRHVARAPGAGRALRRFFRRAARQPAAEHIIAHFLASSRQHEVVNVEPRSNGLDLQVQHLRHPRRGQVQRVTDLPNLPQSRACQETPPIE